MSLAMEVNVEYLAAGGNRHPAAADWDAITGLLAYGSGRNLALWEPSVLSLTRRFMR